MERLPGEGEQCVEGDRGRLGHWRAEAKGSGRGRQAQTPSLVRLTEFQGGFTPER